MGASLDFWILESRHPGILKSPGYGLFLPISRYRVHSHSVFVKELDFQSRIAKFHHSWNLPGIIWNSGIPLDFSYFLTNSRYRELFPLNFKLRNWFWMQNFKIPSFLESSRNHLKLWYISESGLYFAQFDIFGINLT